MTEKQLENNFKKWLESRGIYRLGTPKEKMTCAPRGYYVKRWGGGYFGQAGLPDMQIVINGVCYEIELKSATGKPSSLQIKMLEQINISGGVGCVLRPQNYKNIKNTIMNTLEKSGSRSEG